MLNVEELIALAEDSGFKTIVRRSSYPLDTAVESSARAEESFAVCVAAPPYDPSDRCRPFNLKSDGAALLIERNVSMLREAARLLSPDGLMFVYGLPQHLPRYATALSNDLTFRYWIAVRAMTAPKDEGLRPEHTGLLLLSKPGASLNRVRVPHAMCRRCGKTLKDWGGKSHLMHPRGVALSDVWMDIVVDPQNRMPAEIFERILQLSSSEDRGKLLLIAPDETAPIITGRDEDQANISAFNPLIWKTGRNFTAKRRDVPAELVDCLRNAPCLEMLKAIPSETIDLAFADPPFNLTKNYNGYSDDKVASDYTGWCKRWLVEYERVLKPGGAMMILNLPKWSVWLADFLSRTSGLFLQNWIVWDSLPEPKGVMMPAHYSLLYFTKGTRPARFNYCLMENGWEPFDEAVFPPDRPDVCRRRQCVKKRRASSATWRGELTDIWNDIHRERLAGRKAQKRKAHPCATPERLIDRIIRLTTDPGDLVLDAFAGVGTTAFVARRLNRRFIAIEQDDSYLRVAEDRMEDKISEPRLPLQRQSAQAGRGKASKRGLQIELQRLALALGRLPTKSDVEIFSSYELQVYEAAFASWSAALKAAMIVVNDSSARAIVEDSMARRQLELFKSSRKGGDVETSKKIRARLLQSAGERDVAEYEEGSPPDEVPVAGSEPASFDHSIS